MKERPGHLFQNQRKVVQQEPPGRATSGALKLQSCPSGEGMTEAGAGTSVPQNTISTDLCRRPAPARSALRAVVSGRAAPTHASRLSAPPRRTWVRVSAAASKAPHRKAAANSASSARCSQGSVMAPSPPGRAAAEANRPTPPYPARPTSERVDITSGRGIYLQR